MLGVGGRSNCGNRRSRRPECGGRREWVRAVSRGGGDAGDCRAFQEADAQHGDRRRRGAGRHRAVADRPATAAVLRHPPGPRLRRRRHADSAPGQGRHRHQPRPSDDAARQAADVGDDDEFARSSVTGLSGPVVVVVGEETFDAGRCRCTSASPRETSLIKTRRQAITRTDTQGCTPSLTYRHTHTHTHTHGPFSRTTRVSRYQKGKTNLDFTEARDSEWQWHQLRYMQVCTSLQTTDNHASTPLYCPSCRPANSVNALKA